MWAAGYLGWLPASGLTRPLREQPIGRSASSLVSHAAYGSISALPLALTGRFLA